MKHTPGPWFYYVTPSGVRYKVHGPTVDYFICDVKGANDLANAKLIAASPDMLEALNKITNVCDPENREDYDPWAILLAISTIARETIEKATGEKQTV